MFRSRVAGALGWGPWGGFWAWPLGTVGREGPAAGTDRQAPASPGRLVATSHGLHRPPLGGRFLENKTSNANR